jgi:hypothetical protein
MEHSTSYARKQMERLASYGQELAGLAQKGMTETVQSVQEEASKVSRRT